MGTAVGKVAHLGISGPIVDPLARVRNIQTLLKQRLDGLDPNKKETRAARALVVAIEGKDAVAREQAAKTRLAEIKAEMTPQTSELVFEQQLELLCVICLGHERLTHDTRYDACALLQLAGSEENVQVVCTAFPGFKHAFDV